MARVPPIRKTAKVAPYQSCVACYRGDVDTVVPMEGSAEFIIVAIHKLAGLPLDDAKGTFKVLAEQEMGLDPGKVPTGRVQVAVRLCRDCAAKTGAVVSDHAEVVEGEPVYTYREPEEADDG